MGHDVFPGQPRILVAAGPEAVSRTAADLVVARLAAAVGARGVVHVALTGGSSASGLYRELCRPEWRTALDWSRVQCWFGDDRVVPLDHPDSNAGLAIAMLLGPDGPGIQPEHLHPMLAGVDPGATDAGLVAAGLYASALAEHVPGNGAAPAFDLVLLGMGPDGHVLSVFPDSPALRAGSPLVMPIPAPTHIGPAWPRVTLGPAIIGAAGAVLLVCAGGSKAPTVVDVLGPLWDPMRLPAQLARIDTATWLLDPDSSALLVRG